MPNPMRKNNEFVYVFRGDVYKWFRDHGRAFARVRRSRSNALSSLCPKISVRVGGWYKYKYVEGEILTNCTSRLEEYLDWMERHAWSHAWKHSDTPALAFTLDFYRDKTLRRIAKYEDVAFMHEFAELDWNYVAFLCTLCDAWHGDCSFENVVCHEWFTILDWREDIRGDVYYDIAKLLKSVYFKHDTVTESGTFERHENAGELENLLKTWCEKNQYSWHHVKLVCAIAVLAMAGSHDGGLGQNLFDLGKEMFRVETT
jgi:hypothetical protein